MQEMSTLDSRVVVVSSDALAAMRLTGLAGRRGRVVEIVFGSGRKPIGCMVCLDVAFQGECLWFVPENAVKDEDYSQ